MKLNHRERKIIKMVEIFKKNFLGDDNKDYETHYSHSHCWAQGGKPACGQPLENHKQCCLCDTVYKPRTKKLSTSKVVA